MIELRISEAAAHTIVEQMEYYEQASNLALARRWEEAVDQTVNSLRNLPERGALCRFRSSALSGLRWVFVSGFPKHMVFYRYLPQDQAIQILHLLHGARDLETLLNDDA